MSIRWNCNTDGCYKEKCVPDWGPLDGYLPRGCRPTDVDGIIEIDGRFLLLEFKSHGGQLQCAQRWLFERLTADSSNVLVVVMSAGTNELESLQKIRFVRNGKMGEWIPCNLSQFIERYRNWGETGIMEDPDTEVF